jgi:SAM-dependent methyltransferase
MRGHGHRLNSTELSSGRSTRGPGPVGAGHGCRRRPCGGSTLRAWSAERRRLRPGSIALELGCGPGAAAAQLVPFVGERGRVLGIDSSETMIDAARRLQETSTTLEFTVGDATRLELADGSFDAYRCERTYQHLTEPEAALAEACRVVRPGGRVAVIDSDWGTFAIDHPNRELTERLAAVPRRFPSNSWSGRRLRSQMVRAGLHEVTVRAETLVATSWDPDVSPGVLGLPPFERIAEAARALGVFDEQDAADWLEGLADEARAGRFFVMVTMVAGVATVP